MLPVPDPEDMQAYCWWSKCLCCPLSQGLADNSVISRVDGELWDLDRPLEQDCSLELLRFDNDDAQAVSGVSSMHFF